MLITISLNLSSS